ncbi:metalloregulator ArsR/SmtB family transcription factor [Plantactinospora sp. KLBMP9567]|uniref:ArsR/SmtB family transcription factor n=1 Tax=Plantactinospora sp. KLBMP9567 TaxID=3085900 RepID=UPI002980E839|nr:metalloregulator ArsR/SmtB family transcription factor [Plantactinospora sp. KLBMP9567]MDW5328278.1 metalloregulator ArsR/SmtB family transcription factor [Plantactinospora sp. KLBMP9567]
MHAFDILGDPRRRRILELLADGEQTSGAITDVIRAEFAISQPAVSQHLRVLRDSGFASVRTEGARLALLALARMLAAGETADREVLEKSPEGREFIRRSAAAWGEAHLAAGGEPEHVAAAVEATTKFYAPDPI